MNASNNMPELAQAPAPGQKTRLSLERTLSTIPRPAFQEGDGSAGPDRGVQSSESRGGCPVHHQTQEGQDQPPTWVYPSPQQFYNALVRKGWETPEAAIPIMVDIHNWMNEAVWNEVLRWENRYHPRPPHHHLSLVKFQGRPTDLSPKARFHLLLSTVFPSLYNPIKPFDRHDWSVSRDPLLSTPSDASSSTHPPEHQIPKPKLSRYVIDYYNGGTDQEGNPVFHFDVRPAIDDLDSLVVRLKEWARIKHERWFAAPQDHPASAPAANIVHDRAES